MSDMIPFIYREFYDVPRMIVLTYRDKQLLLESRFDEDADDYPNAYQVLLLPGLRPDELAGSWDALADRAVRNLGSIAVKDLVFDPTRRRALDARSLDRFALAE